MNQNFIIFRFDDEMVLVSFVCKGREIPKIEIEDAMSSYLEDKNDEDITYEEIINDVMVSFEDDGLEYHIEDFWLCEC